MPHEHSKLSLDPATVDHLTSTYGKDALSILDLIEQESDLKERICPEFPPLMAEIIHCVNNEMTISLEDFLARRIRLAMLQHKLCLEAAPKSGSYYAITFTMGQQSPGC